MIEDTAVPCLFSLASIVISGGIRSHASTQSAKYTLSSKGVSRTPMMGSPPGAGMFAVSFLAIEKSSGVRVEMSETAIETRKGYLAASFAYSAASSLTALPSTWSGMS